MIIFNPFIINKDGVRGPEIGRISWGVIKSLEMTKQEVDLRGPRSILNAKSTELRWGIVIDVGWRDYFIQLPEDRPDMELLHDLELIAQVPVTIDKEAKSEYDKGIALYLENKAAQKAANQNPPPKPVDNSSSAPHNYRHNLVVPSCWNNRMAFDKVAIGANRLC